ncbi:hypothetical protein D3C73_1466140 [compost metagenome]
MILEIGLALLNGQNLYFSGGMAHGQTYSFAQAGGSGFGLLDNAIDAFKGENKLPVAGDRPVNEEIIGSDSGPG